MACNLNRAQILLGCAIWWAGALGLAGCGSDSDDPEPSGSAGIGAGAGGSATATAGSGGSAGQTAAAGSSGSGGGGSGSGVCESVITEYPPASFNHVTNCSPLTFDSNPPAGGDHYAVWAAFQTYDFPVPAGYLVHSLEHGAVVYWYNCPDGCPDEVAQAQAMIDALPSDPLCAGTSSQRRVILVPSPELDVRWAASSWGYIIKADCFDADALSTFYMEHVGQAREDLCNDGLAFDSNPCP